MWIELQVILKDQIVNWKELGFNNHFETARRTIKFNEIYYLQELLADIQIITFQDLTSIYVIGSYETIRDTILHLSEGYEE
jgi:hypothetical protein